jgi:hypothetical protein
MLGLALAACGGRTIGTDGGSTDASGGSEAGSSDGGGQTDSSGGDDGGGNTSGPGTTSGPCGEETFMPVRVPVVFAFVAERSAHMAATWDHDADPATAEVTRWQGVHEAVSTVIDRRCSYDAFGLWLYPSDEATNEYGVNGCLASDMPDVSPEHSNQDQILATLPPATPGPSDLVGASPAAAAYENAISHLVGLDPNLEKWVVLLAHLPAQCAEGSASDQELMEVYDPALLERVHQAREEHGIHTYVVGIDIDVDVTPESADWIPDGVSPFEVFNDLAVAGGMPRGGPQGFYGATDLIELQVAIECQGGEIVTCVLAADDAPEGSDPMRTEVRLEDVLIPRIEDCATEDGWTYVNPDGPYSVIELCGQACEDLGELAEAAVYPDWVEILITYYCG